VDRQSKLINKSNWLHILRQLRTSGSWVQNPAGRASFQRLRTAKLDLRLACATFARPFIYSCGSRITCFAIRISRLRRAGSSSCRCDRLGGDEWQLSKYPAASYRPVADVAGNGSGHTRDRSNRLSEADRRRGHGPGLLAFYAMRSSHQVFSPILGGAASAPASGAPRTPRRPIATPATRGKLGTGPARGTRKPLNHFTA